jgi:hypothetical protein
MKKLIGVFALAILMIAPVAGYDAASLKLIQRVLCL